MKKKTFLMLISTVAQPRQSWRDSSLRGLGALWEDATWIVSPMENAMCKYRKACEDEISILYNRPVPP
jgi:hypothetical protein